MKSYVLLLIIFTTFYLFSCSSVRYLNPAERVNTVKTSSFDIHIITKKMLLSLAEHLKGKEKDTYIKFGKLRNRSSEHIDTVMLKNIIANQLVKRKIKFIDTENTAAFLKIIKHNQMGITNGISDFSKLKSPNFFLTGEITENISYDGGSRYQSLIVTLKLSSVATATIVWSEEKRLLKKANKASLRW